MGRAWRGRCATALESPSTVEGRRPSRPAPNLAPPGTAARRALVGARAHG
jgi:hypothetical protein